MPFGNCKLPGGNLFGRIPIAFPWIVRGVTHFFSQPGSYIGNLFQGQLPKRDRVERRPDEYSDESVPVIPEQSVPPFSRWIAGLKLNIFLRFRFS